MSHQTTIDAVILGDELGLSALRAAALELGCLLQPGAARGRVWGHGATESADYIVRVPSARFDVLVTKQEDGTLALATDFYGGSVEETCGENLEKLVQTYQVCRAEIEARSLGYTVSRGMDADTGEVLLTIGGLPE